MTNRIKYILYFTALTALVGACQSNQQEQNESSTLGADELEITAEHFEGGGMVIGHLESRSFRDEISCRGYLRAPANGMAEISTPIAGAVKSVHFKLGDYVRRGQTVCTISGNDFLGLQQQYAEASALYSKAQADYERMKMLQDERIGAKKDYLSAESSYKTALAAYNTLKARIRVLNIDPEKIERGDVYMAFPVVTPISGYVTGSHIVVGQYVDPVYNIAEIVDVSQLQLQLSVFGQDIAQVKEGQEVRFTLGGRQDEILTATLASVGKSISPETKTIECIARLNDRDKEHLIHDTYVEAQIITGTKEAPALPATAVQKEGESYFVYVVVEEKGGDYIIARKQVKVGSISKEYFEILSGLDEDTPVLVRGIDTL